MKITQFEETHYQITNRKERISETKNYNKIKHLLATDKKNEAKRVRENIIGELVKDKIHQYDE